MDSIPVVVIRLPPQINVLNIWQNLEANTLELEILYVENNMMRLKTIRPIDLKPLDEGEHNPRF